MKRPSESTLLDTSGRPVGIHAWSKCDYHLLKLLTSGPLLPTKSQLCQPGLRGLFSRTAIRSALRNLRNEGWLQRYNVHLHNPQLPDQPLLVCQSGQACPNFRELKAMLKGRDHQSPTWQSLHVYLPSRQAANLFGTPYFGVGTPETHAYRLAISHVVSLVSTQSIPTPTTSTWATSTWAESSWPESIRADWIWDTCVNIRPYQRVLGICLEISDGSTRAVGIISAQGCQTLERLHAHCSERGWPIELW